MTLFTSNIYSVATLLALVVSTTTVSGENQVKTCKACFSDPSQDFKSYCVNDNACLKEADCKGSSCEPQDDDDDGNNSSNSTIIKGCARNTGECGRVVVNSLKAKLAVLIIVIISFGAAIGCSLVLLAAACGCFWYRRNRRQQSGEGYQTMSEGDDYGTATV